MNITVTFSSGQGASSGYVRVGHNSGVQNEDAVWSFTLNDSTSSLTFNFIWNNTAAGTGWQGEYEYAFAISSNGTSGKQLAKGNSNIAKVTQKLKGKTGSTEVKFNTRLNVGTYYIRANQNGTKLSSMKAFSTTATGSAVGEGSLGGSGGVPARKIYIEKSIKKADDDNTVDRLLMCGYGGMLQRSDNGTSWTAINTGVMQNYFGVNFLGAKYIAVGTNGRVSVSADMGTTWTHTSLSDQDFESATFSNGLWVVSGGNEIWVSTDTENWEMVLKDTTKNHHLEGVMWDGEKFIAYGFYELNGFTRTGGFYFSNDGYSWDWVNWSGDNLYSYVNKMIKAKGFIYATGWIDDPRTCAILRSKNGVNWEVVHYFNDIYGYVGITYGNGRLLAYGYEGMISYSDDGIDWTDTTYLSGTIWDAAGYGFGKFVIGGREGTTYKRAYSSDGVTWSGLATNLPYAPADFCYGLSQYHYDIRQACLDELLKRKAIQKVEGEVENSIPPKYGEDYSLGDIIEVNAAGWQSRQRITKVRHILEPNRISITPVIGDDFLDLRQFIAREVNK